MHTAVLRLRRAVSFPGKTQGGIKQAMKKKCCMNHAVQEGILFLMVSGGLMGYSLDAYSKSYNKDWTQSPSLFPMVIAVLLGILAIVLLAQGLRSGTDATAEKGKKGKQGFRAALLLFLVLAYYAALALIDLPYLGVTVMGLTFSVSIFEIATAAFLLAAMAVLGVRSRAMLAGAPLVTAAALSVMFRTLLRVLLP